MQQESHWLSRRWGQGGREGEECGVTWQGSRMGMMRLEPESRRLRMESRTLQPSENKGRQARKWAQLCLYCLQQTLGEGFRYDLACAGEPLPGGICALVHKLVVWKRCGCRVLGIKHGDSQIMLHLCVLDVFLILNLLLLILSCNGPLFISVCAFEKKHRAYRALLVINSMPHSMFWDCGDVCLSHICDWCFEFVVVGISCKVMLHSHCGCGNNTNVTAEGELNRTWCVLLRGAQQLLILSCEFCFHQQQQGYYESGVFSKSSAVLVSFWNAKVWLQAEQWQMFGTLTHVGSVFLPLETSEICGPWSQMQPGLFKAQLII